ncbi:hypothetical protein AB8880_04970 [Alphaproteobacteria bacterium LSUCC0684]
MNFYHKFIIGLLLAGQSAGMLKAETDAVNSSQAVIDTTPPEVLDIDDPFSRDLKRAADDATGGLIFGGQELNFLAEEKIGKALLGKESQAAVIASRFRVMGLALARPSIVDIHFRNSSVNEKAGVKPLLPYLRVGQDLSIDQARQQAIDLMTSYSDFMDMYFIISTKDRRKEVDLDLGPFRSISHAEGFCDLLIDFTEGQVSNCHALLHYPGDEPNKSFTSSAIIRLSPETVANVLKDRAVFDLAAAANQIITIREGETIGSNGAIAVKIIPSGIMLVDQIGNIAKLPTTFIPEEAFQTGNSQNSNLIPSLDPQLPEPEIKNESQNGTGKHSSKTAADLLINQN